MRPLKHNNTQRPPHAIDCTCTMNRGLYIFAGIVIGILLSTAYLYLTARDSVSMFAEPGNTMPFKSFEVFQVLPNGAALASGYENWNAEPDKGCNPIQVYMERMDGVSYYDNLIINVPEGKVVRQTGTFRYETMNDLVKTVPIVRILNR